MAWVKLKTLHGVDIMVNDSGLFQARIGDDNKTSIKLEEVEKAIEAVQPEGSLKLWQMPTPRLESDRFANGVYPDPEVVEIIGIANTRASRGMPAKEAYRIKRASYPGESLWDVANAHVVIPDSEVAAEMRAIREEFRKTKAEYEARLQAAIGRLREVNVTQIREAFRRQRLQREKGEA